MTVKARLARILQQEDLNFLLTNRIPRRVATRFMGWFSRIEHPLIARASIALWRVFCELDLADARETRFASLHACFVRRLRDGARPIDTRRDILVSPCDGIVGACGTIEGDRVFQAKGFPYTLTDLLGDAAAAARFRDGCYVTLRITAAMYHRFHAPHDCKVEQVSYIAGDTWNVNPIALRRVERLFCKNERAALRLRLDGSGHTLTLVPIAAILVAGIRLHFLDVRRHLRHRGVNRVGCDVAFVKGEEMGWFEHGSTIVLLAPRGFALHDGVREGIRVKVGEALLRPPTPSTGQRR